MMLDYYADYYQKLKASGKTEMFEDDDFDLESILSSLESQEPADEWEPVEDWSVNKLGELPED